MRIRVQTIRTLVVAMAFLVPAAALGKNARPNPKADVFPTLKTGQWIRIEGILMKDRTVQCTELKVLAGDFLDDDWGLTGRIEEINVRNRRLTIGYTSVRVAENAVLEGSHGHFKSLVEIKVGMIVELDGTYLKDRTFLAKEVDDESDEITFAPGEQRLSVVGKVEQTDAARRRIQAMGTTFVLTDKTQIKSVIR